MKPWVRWLAWGLVTGGLFFLIGFFNQYHLPRIERWLLQEVESQSTLHSPLRVWPASAKIAFFPPGLVLNKIQLLPQGELKAVLAPAVIERAEVRVNWFYLLTGRLRLSYIGLRGAEIKMVLKDDRSKKKSDLSEFKYDFNKISEIPVDELVIEDLAVWARLENLKTSVYLNNVSLNVENRSRNFLIDLEAPEAQVKWQEAADLIPINLGLRLMLDAKGVRVSSLKVKTGDSFVVAAGTIGTELDLQTRTQIKLADITRWERIVRDPILPLMQGELRADLAVAGPIQNPRLNGKLGATSVKVSHFIIGNVAAVGEWQDGEARLSEASIQSDAGLVQVKKAKWKISKDSPLEGQVSAQDLVLNNLLKNIGLKDVPANVLLNGQLKCAGPVFGNIKIRCEGEVRGNDILVHAGKSKNETIVDIPKAKAKGHVVITTQGVNYEADLQVGEKSRGQSSGVILYQKGFQISYQGENVDFSDLRNLGNLKLEGSGQLKGTTDGNSKTAKFQLNGQFKNVWLEKYWLGNPEAEVSYKSGILQFNKLLGQVGTSRYSGNLSVNFHRKEILIQAQSPYADLLDIKEVFKRHFDLPISVAGTGAMEVRAWGPLKFNQLSYHLNSAFYRGHLANESFDQLQFNMSATNGQAKADKVSLMRSQSVIEVTGNINPQGIIDAVLVGRRLRLEESENINRMGVDMTGQVDMTMAIRGQLPRPILDAHGRLSHLVIGDRVAEDSTFKLKLLQDRMEGGGRFIGNVVNADFVLPLTDKAPFSLKIKTNKWNFANFFSIFSNAARQRDIQTSLSAEMNLQSDRGGHNRASGELTVSELSLKRGAIDIKNNGPIRINMREGTLSSNPFILEGEGGFLKGSIIELNPKDIRAVLNGKLDLSLLTLFTPFLADLQGRLTLNINFSGATTSPLLTGSAYIDQGVVRLKAFPHPFTNLRSDIIFADQGLNINALRAELGGGAVTGEGRIRWPGKNQVPVDVKGQATEVSLNVPEGFRTRGSGNWSVKGNFFPYVLAVNYEVSGGEITAEFQGAGLNNAKVVSPSALLPKFLVQSTDQPITLDLSILLKNPLPIRNSLIESPIRGKLTVTGPPAQPRLTGVLTPAPGGKVFFRDVPFEIQNGFVEYQDDPPDNAKIYLTAQAEVVENARDEGNRSKQNDYQISMLVQGRLKPQPKITLSSLPPLSEKEIVSLLALGMTTTSLDQNRAGSIAASNSVQYGAAILQKPLSKEVRNRLGLEMQISQTSSNSGDSASYTQFTLTKQFTPKWNASASRTIEKNPTNSAKMEYKFNKGLSVIGSWEGKEGIKELGTENNVQESVFGLDLEYKVNFK
ncbi:MAG: translocation/assembly module TamB domain-containing protein [Bdellovibrionales bacterium]